MIDGGARRVSRGGRPGLAGHGRRIELLWIAIGDDDPSLEAHKRLNACLDSRGVKYTYSVYPNEWHWWTLWHRNFAEFARLIFK